MLTVKSSLVDTYSDNNRSISLSSSAFGRSISLSSTVFGRSISTLLGRCCSQKNRWISQTSTVTSQISRRQTQGSKRRGKRARLRGKFQLCMQRRCSCSMCSRLRKAHSTTVARPSIAVDVVNLYRALAISACTQWVCLTVRFNG